MSYAQAAATYQRNAVMTASPEKLIKLLYDGAIKHLEQSRTALMDESTSRSPEVGMSMSKAMGIIGELRASLDHTVGGDVSRNLEQLYEFVLDQLSQANLQRTPDGVNSALEVMRTLKEGWDGIVPA
ncbi:flagellar export chaperone FliS [bacterium]|jgi:flagellar secretion chaperone FliS|nr:flagellar export chaperone FliS [bacterium]